MKRKRILASILSLALLLSVAAMTMPMALGAGAPVSLDNNLGVPTANTDNDQFSWSFEGGDEDKLARASHLVFYLDVDTFKSQNANPDGLPGFFVIFNPNAGGWLDENIWGGWLSNSVIDGFSNDIVSTKIIDSGTYVDCLEVIVNLENHKYDNHRGEEGKIIVTTYTTALNGCIKGGGLLYGTPVIIIKEQPEDRSVSEGEITGDLSVDATGKYFDGAYTLEYQWYSNTTKSNTGGTAISGATNADFTIPTTLTVTSGTSTDYYYYCVVSAAGAASVTTDVATVTVSTLPVITITTQPAATTEFTVGSISGNLTVAATVTQGKTATYQWYTNTTNSTTGATAIPGATSATFAIPANLSVGTYYYYCVVSADTAAPVTSGFAEIKVKAIPEAPSGNKFPLGEINWKNAPGEQEGWDLTDAGYAIGSEVNTLIASGEATHFVFVLDRAEMEKFNPDGIEGVQFIFNARTEGGWENPALWGDFITYDGDSDDLLDAVMLEADDNKITVSIEFSQLDIYDTHIKAGAWQIGLGFYGGAEFFDKAFLEAYLVIKDQEEIVLPEDGDPLPVHVTLNFNAAYEKKSYNPDEMVAINGKGNYKLDIDVANLFDGALTKFKTIQIHSVNSTKGKDVYEAYSVYFTKVVINDDFELTINPEKEGTEGKPAILYGDYDQMISVNLANVWHMPGTICDEMDIEAGDLVVYDDDDNIVGISNIYVEFTVIDTPEPEPTPAPTATPTPAPDDKPGEKPGPSNPYEGDDEKKVEAFTWRLYSILLGREPDEKGFEDWVEMLRNGEVTAVEVMYGFIFSPEFLANPPDNEEFVEFLFEALMDRTVREDELKDWLPYFETSTLYYIFYMVSQSKEFEALCKEYGIIQGTYWPDKASLDDVESFVIRAYNMVLGRFPSTEEQETWINALTVEGKGGREVVLGFLGSQEFLEKGLEGEAFLKVLYDVFLGRGLDDNGRETWLPQLEGADGVTKVIDGIAGSDEFGAICDGYGINP